MKQEKDKCITCNEESLYDKDINIKFRLGYIEGAGQLCLECYDKIYVIPKVEKKIAAIKKGRYIDTECGLKLEIKD